MYLGTESTATASGVNITPTAIRRAAQSLTLLTDRETSAPDPGQKNSEFSKQNAKHGLFLENLP